MAREICIKTSSGMYCKSSPIRDCSCDRDPDFSDPFPELPVELGSPTSVLSDLETVIKRAAHGTDPDELAERFRVLATIARLVMLPDVRIKEPFLIMSMDLGIPTGSSAN
jgi:hypothetical protein